MALISSGISQLQLIWESILSTPNFVKTCNVYAIKMLLNHKYLTIGSTAHFAGFVHALTRYLKLYPRAALIMHCNSCHRSSSASSSE